MTPRIGSRLTAATQASQDRLKKRTGTSSKPSAGKEESSRAQYILSFLILSLTAGITIGNEVLIFLRIDRNYLIITLIAVVVSLLAAHRHILFVVLIVGVSLAVNLPVDVLVDFGINKNILLLTLMVIILEPLFRRFS